jgi:hypothetical protein
MISIVYRKNRDGSIFELRSGSFLISGMSHILKRDRPEIEFGDTPKINFGTVPYPSFPCVIKGGFRFFMGRINFREIWILRKRGI